MRALIFNSGTGSRMGGLTKDRPKCLLEIAEGVTILDWQVKSLTACGIHSFVITTGEYDAMIRQAISAGQYAADFAFVNNPLYDSTNYIYSFYLARKQFTSSDSVIMLHGDMVFEESVLRGLVSCNAQNAVVVNKGAFLSEKDFNAAVAGGIVTRICAGDKTADNFLLPVYKLGSEGFKTWLDAVGELVAKGETGVYAEEAFNAVSGEIRLKPFYIDIDRDFCMEVDEAGELDMCRDFFVNR